MQQMRRAAQWRRGVRKGQQLHPSQVGFWSLALALRARPVPKSSNGAFTAVITVHKRPANLDTQVRAALQCSAVDNVIVSSNNPEVRLRDWLTVSSPRLTVMEEAERNQTRRFAIAAESGNELFVLPDDDVLFTPENLRRFCESLPADRATPRGLAGQRCSVDGAWESAISGNGEEVDVLNRAYVCTAEHAKGVFKTADLLGWSEAEIFSNPADDLLLSFSGATAPRVVAIDHVNCVSFASKAISTYRQENFNPARGEWVAELRSKLGWAPASRSEGTQGALRQRPLRGPARVVNVAARPLRRRFYFGKHTVALSSLPAAVRDAAGLHDYGAVWSRRFQVGMQPTPLEGYIRIGSSQTEPDLAACFPPWNLEFRRDFATEIVSIGVLDDIAPHLVPTTLASWRAMMRTGARLVVGVRDSSATLAERDAKLGEPSWASQLPDADNPLHSPFQLVDAGLHHTLWDADRLRDAIDAQGFDVLSVTTGARLVDDPNAGGRVVPIRGGEQEIGPLPYVLHNAADLVAIAIAR